MKCCFQLKKFKRRNPENYRVDAGDVILLITDGAPNPDYTGYRSPRRRKLDQKRMADEYSGMLKNNSVLIVGLAAGRPERVAEFKPFLKTWATSPDLVFEAQLDTLHIVLNELVDTLCKPSKCRNPCRLPSVIGLLLNVCLFLCLPVFFCLIEMPC